MSKELEEIKEVEIGVEMEEWTASNKLLLFKLRKSKSQLIGRTLNNSKGESYQVLGSLDTKDCRGRKQFFLIEFEDSTRIVVHEASIRGGQIRNSYTSSVCSTGFLGQGSYNYKSHSKEYRTWCNMLERCYSEKSQKRQPTYIECTVDIRWYNFQNFCEDIVNLEGYKAWKENTKKNAYALDKDIKIKGNKLYSKDACMFVTIVENQLEAHKGKEGNLTGKNYQGTNPVTEKIEDFTNMTKFSRHHNLDPSAVRKCMNGEYEQTKGWTFEVVKDPID